METKIELPDYKKIAFKVKKRKVSVKEQEIENALKWLQKSRAKLTLKNEPAQKGDFVEIEYWLDQEEKSRKDAFILGEGHFISGFEQEIIGMKAGEEKENINLNKDGKKLNLKLKIKTVQNAELPEINDEFAKGLGNFESLAHLKKNIQKGIALEKERIELEKTRREILEKISKKANLEIAVVLQEIAKREKIEVSDQEVMDEVNKVLRSFPSIKEAEKSIGVDLQKFKEYTKQVIRNEKIFRII